MLQASLPAGWKESLRQLHQRRSASTHLLKQFQPCSTLSHGAAEKNLDYHAWVAWKCTVCCIIISQPSPCCRTSSTSASIPPPHSIDNPPPGAPVPALLDGTEHGVCVPASVSVVCSNPFCVFLRLLYWWWSRACHIHSCIHPRAVLWWLVRYLWPALMLCQPCQFGVG